MRAWWLLLLIPGASAGLLGQDPANDHGPVLAQNDLLALHGELIDDDLVLQIQVQDLQPPAHGVLVDSTFYTIQFEFDGARYELDVSRRIHAQSNLQGPALSASLHRSDYDGTTQIASDLQVEEDAAEGLLTMHVPWRLLTDGQGTPLYPGAVLNQFAVDVTNEADSVTGVAAGAGPVPRATPHDRLPDTGFAPGQITSANEATQGTVALMARNPVEASNGGPRSFMFQVDARNLAAEAQDVTFELANVPPSWTAAVVPSATTLLPEETQLVTVVVRSQGAHGHGGQDTFQLIGSHSEPLDLTIHYPAIPEPAGHHNVLWFHSARLPERFVVDDEIILETYGRPSGRFWMNTLEDDERDEDRAVANNPSGQEPDWQIPVSLGTGLEILDGMAQVELSFQPSQSAATDPVQFSLELFWQGSERIVLASMEPDAAAPIPADGGVRSFELPLEQQTLPSHPEARLVLAVYLHYPDPTSTGVPDALLTGGQMQLPLGEYDPALPADVLAALEDAGVLDESGDLITPGETQASSKDSPGAGFGFLAALLAIVAVRRVQQP